MEVASELNHRRYKALRIFAGLRTREEIAADRDHIQRRTADLAALRSEVSATPKTGEAA